MTLTRRLMALLLTLFSVVSILGAWAFEAAGILPCAMCYWQRWGHWAALAFGWLAFFFGQKVWFYLAGLGALSTSLIGFYHSGVERKWWLGPSSCTGRGLSADSGNLLSFEGAAPVLCDEIPWQMFGITMANLNAVGSLVVAGLWFWAATWPAEGRRFF